jgi:hypothetical protein
MLILQDFFIIFNGSYKLYCIKIAKIVLIISFASIYNMILYKKNNYIYNNYLNIDMDVLTYIVKFYNIQNLYLIILIIWF